MTTNPKKCLFFNRFNSVYNYTDLPSFISGKYLVLFDPHVRFLPNISLANPGLKIDISRQGIMEKFPDQFKPYQCLGHNLYRRDGFDGTLFRVPLRRDLADSELSSEISSTYTSLFLSSLIKYLLVKE